MIGTKLDTCNMQTTFFNRVKHQSNTRNTDKQISRQRQQSTNKFTMSSITHVSFFFHFTPIIISTTSTFFSTVTRITFCFSSYLVSFPVLGRQVSTRDVGTTMRGHKRQKKHSKHFSFLSGMTKKMQSCNNKRKTIENA
jgi:hypothetical protein